MNSLPRVKSSCAAAAALFIASMAALAQEQVFNISGPSGVLSTPESFVDVNAATLPMENAEPLIDATFGAPARMAPDLYCIIHVLRWSDEGKVEADNWYLYHSGATWSDAQYSALRIYGSHNVALLFVHLNAKGVAISTLAERAASAQVLNEFYGRFNARQEAPKKAALQTWLALGQMGTSAADREAIVLSVNAPAGSVAATLSPDRKKLRTDADQRAAGNAWAQASLEDLEELFLQAETARLPAARLQSDKELSATAPRARCGSETSRGRELLRAPGATVCVVEDFMKTTYKVEVTKKLPSAVGDLFALLGLQARNRAEVPLVPVALWGGRRMRIGPLPSDMKVTPTITVSGKQNALSSRTYDNEGRYYWDISAAIPLRSIKATQYDATAFTFVPKKIEKQSLYAALNAFPFKVDTKGTSFRWFTPMLLAGMGITERPLDRLMFAGGLGFNKVQFYAGTALTKKTFPGPVTDPTATTQAYRTNLIFGLNVPLRQVVQALKAPK